MKTNYLCVPKFKLTAATTTSSASYGRNNRRLSPMTLLDRLRQAVYRIIMLNALCKTNQKPDHHGSGCSTSGKSDQVRCGYNYLYDPHHNEAVADCIEFIKKTGITPEENHRESSTTDGSIDAAPDLVFSVPVM